ncbi:TonB-dependent receptor [Myroides sp. DW712]|uniref:TonB-dependent receptor n=1 Tax=Myroides sp. DW712 TaxID=3389800 RepID=UPI003979E84D
MKIGFSWFFFFFVGLVQAQQITLSGTVVSKKNKPIENVNIYLEDSFDGALSDARGHFSFVVQDTVVQGVLKFTHPQFDEVSLPIDTKEDWESRMVLSPRTDAMQEIVIRTKGKAKFERAESIGFTAMDVVSTAGSPGNIIGVLSTLPGAQVAGEDGRLMIRGGRPEESGIVVNGIKVFQPYTASMGNIPVRAKFSPFLFRGMSFSAGGYSAEFGDALSGILQLDTSNDIDPSRQDFSISTVGGSAAQTYQWGKSSLSYNLSYLNLGAYTVLVKQRYTTRKPFATLAGEMQYKRETPRGGYKLYAAVDRTSMKYEQEIRPSNRVDTLELKSDNLYLNSLYFAKLSSYLKLELGTGIGYSKYKGDQNEKQRRNTSWDWVQKVKLSYQWNGQLRSVVGVDFQFLQLDLVQRAAVNVLPWKEETTQWAFFLENNWKMSPVFTLRVGTRITKYSIASDWNVEPRTLLTYQPNLNHSISFAYGVFNQKVGLESTVLQEKETPMQAQHWVGNYTYTFKKHQLRAEVFYKTYDKLLLTPLDQQRNHTQNGKGYARGLDLFWKNNSLRNVQFWVTYTYTDSQRKESYWEQWMQPAYVVKNSLVVVGKHWFEPWKSQVSLTYHYSSPRTFHDVYATNTITYQSSPVHNLSLSWAYVFHTQKIVYLAIDNLLGRDPVYAYQFTAPQASPDVVRGSAKRFIYVGFMWTLSADKKSNQLDNL